MSNLFDQLRALSQTYTDVEMIEAFIAVMSRAGGRVRVKITYPQPKKPKSDLTGPQLHALLTCFRKDTGELCKSIPSRTFEVLWRKGYVHSTGDDNLGTKKYFRTSRGPRT